MEFQRRLLKFYRRLYAFYGPQKWWPAEGPFEVMVGAILTQNTSWLNAEKAIENLKAKGLLSPRSLKKASPRVISELIRPAGYYRLKTKRLKNFVEFFSRTYRGSITLMRKTPCSRLRNKLLSVSGIGPETADSILLYALNKPVFVIDAYTKRILNRHRIISDGYGYAETQRIFEDNLPRKSKLFNEYHALLVRLGKEYCKKTKAQCARCPIKED